MHGRAPLRFEDSPYRPPEGALQRFVWRRKIWIEVTFGLSVLEPWEKALVWSVFALMTVLFVTGFYRLMPQHLDLVHRRTVYYVTGDGVVS
ncbi:hypothetical protein PUNSTDRAFT_115908 [Punctularia strigosozonata HHB-11173 SS5]|uniref:uncharacterized protein n=1 Tax=Punctularia strigosozonata (strain HHB-11173) TaxID=741275 RepID=UPI0004416A1A|nr:uncharacterized protein PUNSTDRAFT_115908 [Punctularia strigosozonata HHB-11173 SS5]EIN05473.1 hypothetical protein PUNSTDRAFT_115908 [Punctularia strigosozonata HHB-11173 SS5]